MGSFGHTPAALDVEHVGKVYQPPPWWLRPLIKTASREPVAALRDTSFTVHTGEIVGLVGPNGAGKTTLIRIIATLLEPTTGRVSIGGVDIAGEPSRARQSIGLVLSDDRGLYWRMTGRQNLEFFGVMAGLSPSASRSRAGELLELVDLHERDKLVFGYSAGMRTRLNLARALLSDPQLLVLDEPTRGLDPLATHQVAGILEERAAEGKAVLLSSHRLDEVSEVCDRVVALVGGRVKFAGRPSDLDDRGGGAASALIALLSEHEEVP
jgi:ABC-2 type transport system ATP-binding protein